MSQIFPGHSMFHRTVALALALFLGVSFADPRDSRVEAQDSKKKEFAKSLLRALIESQLDRDRNRGNLPPAPGQQVPAAPVTAEMQQLRPILASLAEESSNFSSQLSADGQFNVNLRQGSAEALHFQASATALQQRAAAEPDHRLLNDGLRKLSADWKTLAHHVQSTGGIGPHTKQTFDRISRLDAQYCQLLGIQEQIDGRMLNRIALQLEADMRTLADEVFYSNVTVQNRQQVVGQLRRIQDQTHEFSHSISDGDSYQSLVAEYQQAHRAWTQLHPSLDQDNMPSMVRAIARIQDGHREMHRLLRISLPVDVAALQRMAKGIHSELLMVTRTITLEQLLTIPDGRSILSSSDAAVGRAQNLIDAVADPNQIASAGQSWILADEAWTVLAVQLEPIQNPETRQHIEHVNQTIISMRNALGVKVVYDHRVVAQRAASLHALADRFDAIVHQWLGRPGKQDQAVEIEVEALEQRCHELETLATSRNQKPVLRAKCDEALEEWHHLRPLLLRCDTEERQTLDRLTDSFIPELVKMRLMLED